MRGRLVWARRRSPKPVFPEHMQMAEKRGLKDHDPDSEVPYLAWSPAGVMREAKFVTVIMPMATTGEEGLCRVEPLTGDNAIGVRVRSAATITDVYLNLMADGRRMHRNSNNIINGWDTDAYLIAMTRPTGTDENDPDSVTRYFIGCGSYLRKDDKVVLHCLSKVYTAFTSGSPAMEIVLQGQPLVRACVRAPERPREVRLNGESRTVNYDAGRKAVKLYLDGGG